MDTVDTIVVGAGVVGLGVARACARAGRPVLILDGEPRFGTWTSSRNSEVIHAGIHYPAGSLKARLCVEGRHQLYDFCRDFNVPHLQCGKLIVASNADQVPELERIAAAADANGVSDLQFLSGREAAALEPHAPCAAALLSPSTGIVDSHAFMLALLGDAEAHGARLVCNTRVERLVRAGDHWQVWFAGGEEPVCGRTVINSAGLAAQALAAATEGLDPCHVSPLFLARGVYFTYAGEAPFERLIYPVPEPGGLGTHLTLDMAGQARFGPDVEWIDRVDYTVDPGRRAGFEAAVRKIWPGVDVSRLAPGYAGIRPKVSGPGEAAADFIISGPGAHGLPGLVNLFGIESPGLTASLAIADCVAGMVGE